MPSFYKSQTRKLQDRLERIEIAVLELTECYRLDFPISNELSQIIKDLKQEDKERSVKRMLLNNPELKKRTYK